MAEMEQIFRFRIGGFTYGLPAARVDSSLRCENVQLSPAAQGPFGWMLSPREVEIWQLHRLLGLDPGEAAGALGLALEGTPRRALLIDEVLGPVVAGLAEQVPAGSVSGPLGSPLVSSFVLDEGEPLPVLDLEALFAGRLPGQKAWKPGRQWPRESAMGGRLPMVPASSDQALRAAISPAADLILPMSQVRAVTSGAKPVPLPGSAEFVLGVAGLSGEVALWIDWPALLGLPPAPPAGGVARLVWMASNWGHLFVFQVAGEMGTAASDLELELVEKEGFPLPSVLLEAGYAEGRLVVVPDLDGLACLGPMEES
ncbi:MAG: hypothetical protein KDD47_15455 [Acidobacteria bacterium]|nr:hypothetical protein [Acidobacteriota bacterium]